MARGTERLGAAVDENGNNELVPQRIDKMMRAPDQERGLLEITPPRIAPFVKHGNDFRDRVVFRGLKVRSLRAFGVARCSPVRLTLAEPVLSRPCKPRRLRRPKAIKSSFGV